MKDEGAELAKQWSLGTSTPIQSYLFWLSNLTGYYWQHLTDGYGLMGARLGGVLINSLIGATIYLIWAKVLGPKLALFCVIATSMASSFSGLSIISYKSYPPLLMFGSAACLWLGTCATSDNRTRFSLISLGGILLGGSVLARLPYLAASSLVLPVMLADKLLPNKTDGHHPLQAPIIYLGAGGITLAFASLAMMFSGDAQLYLKSINDIINKSDPIFSSHYTFDILGRLYLSQGAKSIIVGLNSCCFIFISAIASSIDIDRPAKCLIPLGLLICAYLIIGERYLPILALVIMSTITKPMSTAGLITFLLCAPLAYKYLSPLWAFIAAALLVIGFLLTLTSVIRPSLYKIGVLAAAIFSGLMGLPFHHLLPGLCLVLSSIVCLASLINRSLPNQREIFITSLLGLISGLVACLGSNQVLGAIYDGLWILLPASAFFGASAFVRFMELSSFRGEYSISAKQFALVIMVVLAILGWHHRFQDPDLTPNINKPWATINHPRLTGIVTERSNAQSIGDLLALLDKLVKVDEPVLAYDSLPMIHFLTRTRPALGDPWPDLLSSQVIEQRLAALRAENYLPTVVIRGPRELISKRIPYLFKHTPMIDDWVQANGYRLYWKNSLFEVLIRN